MRQHRLQTRFRQFRAVARVTEIVWNQIEALRLRRSVSRVINDHCVFGFYTFESVAGTGLEGRRSRHTGEPFDDGQNILLRGVRVEQFDNFDALEAAELRLLATHFVAEAARISDRVLQIVLRVSVFIYSNGDDVSSAFPFQAIRACKHEWRILALDRKSTRLNSSHGYISYAVFCL